MFTPLLTASMSLGLRLTLNPAIIGCLNLRRRRLSELRRGVSGRKFVTQDNR